MIKITKESKIYSTFKKLNCSFAKTTNHMELPNRIIFTNGNISIRFHDDDSEIFIKDDNIDMADTFRIDENVESFMMFVLSHFVDTDEPLELAYNAGDEKLTFVNRGYVFNAPTTDFDGVPNVVKMMTYTQEEYAKLEPLFGTTLSNLSKPSTIDTINFGFREGKPIIVTANEYFRKFESPKANIDSVSIEQTYGHSCSYFIFPKKYYDLFKDNEGNIDIDFTSDEYMAISCDGIVAKIFPERHDFKTVLAPKCSYDKSKSFKELRKKILEQTSRFTKVLPENLDDIIMTIGHNEVAVNGIKVLETQIPEEIDFEPEISALHYILEHLNEECWYDIVETDDGEKRIELYDDDSWYFMICN